MKTTVNLTLTRLAWSWLKQARPTETEKARDKAQGAIFSDEFVTFIRLDSVLASVLCDALPFGMADQCERTIETTRTEIRPTV
jgi:hypothetical protein